MLRFAFVTLFGGRCAAETDEISLLQGYAPKKDLQMDHAPHGQSIAALMESAQNMLKNGATPDVVEFAQATLHEITGVVIPAIANASESDQAWVYATFALFEEALAELELGTASINAMNAEERSHSTAHKACRDVEHQRCTTKTTCDYDLWALWNDFIEEERELRTISATIEGHFCLPDANGTTQIFRETSVPRMRSFIAQKEVVETSFELYGDKVPQCEQRFAQLDEMTAECDAHQTRLEQAACAHAVEVRRVRERTIADWRNAVSSYNSVVNEVRLLVIDRIQEFRVLTQMQCLMNRTSERNGRPCDAASGETETELTRCEEVRDEVDISWLELIYPEIPPPPPPCPDRDSVEGRCMPDEPPFPCTGDFIVQEYSVLPAVPQPDFNHENSHCNHRPECQACEAMGKRD